MWVSKSADERKREFAEAAARLFAQKGYDQTSVADIIAAVGVTKGSFYYHYPSKEAVVAAIADTLSGGMCDAMRAAAAAGGPAPRLLAAVMDAAVAYRAAHGPQYASLWAALGREDNRLLARRFRQAVEGEAAPLLAEAIRQGNAQGAWHAPDAARTAGLLLKLAALCRAELAQAAQTPPPEGAADAEADAAFWQDAAERLLGAPPGTVPLLPVARRSMTFWKGDEIHANE